MNEAIVIAHGCLNLVLFIGAIVLTITCIGAIIWSLSSLALHHFFPIGPRTAPPKIPEEPLPNRVHRRRAPDPY